MVLSHPFSPMTQCEGKRPFGRSKDAKQHIKFIEAKVGARYVAYRCPHCAAWHVGHDARKRRMDA